MANSNIKIGVIVLLIFAVISVAFGIAFIQQGISKNSMITEALAAEKVSYEAEDAQGAIVGVIDNPDEAQVMSEVLREHRIHNYGYYTELGREDPNRDGILKAITMENSLNLAQLSYGLVTVIIIIGVFMIVVGLAIGTTAFIIRPRA
ncbi:hypothetical protein ACFLYM_02300 [Chloroflexota bacterium]